MRILLLIIFLSAFLQNCMAQPYPRREVYSWLSFEAIPRDNKGNQTGTPTWDTSRRIKFPMDTFIIYKNYDSIRMITPGNQPGKLFKKVNIPASKWKPKPDYGRKLYFLGTYEREELAGIYISIYATKDWDALMQVHYTNPGNITAALLFSKSSINIMKNNGVLVNPKDEISEPENVQVKF